MSDEHDDDDAATMIGKSDAARAAIARPGGDSPTRRFDVQALTGPTRAMPAGYGMPRAVPSPRASSPRPAAGRPAAGRPVVPSVMEDPTSESEMTLIEAIDAELESITAELSIPEGTDPEMLEEVVSASEMTVRMAVPDDLPSNLLDGPSEPGTHIQPPRAPQPPAIHEMRGVPAPPLSLSSMPTPARPTKTQPIAPPEPIAVEMTDIGGVVHEPTVDRPAGAAQLGLAAAGPLAADVVSAERPPGPRPAWVGPYLVACALLSILGAVVLTYLKMQRFW